MMSLKERETNLFNATDTLAQFYEEIESFLSILRREMAKLYFPIRAERLRAGAFTTKNLVRRLPATIMTIYIPRQADDIEENEQEDEEEEEREEEEGETSAPSLSKKEVVITAELKIPFSCIWLFEPKTIPTAAKLKPPLLLSGAFSNMAFIDKKTNEVAATDNHPLSLSNLVQLSIKDSYRNDTTVTMNCWRPKSMKRYKLRAKVLGFASQALMEIDSQEKIRQVAQKIAGL
jgi:hypothetical protein